MWPNRRPCCPERIAAVTDPSRADHRTVRARGYTAAMLIIEGLTRRFGDRVAVDDLCLEVPRGSFVGAQVREATC